MDERQILIVYNISEYITIALLGLLLPPELGEEAR
jgi:hypothetical protein